MAFMQLLSWPVAWAEMFKNCVVVRTKYPNGVAMKFWVMGTSGAEINRTIH